ncbi:MAG: hypothetical protein QOE63_1595 [Acidimicrobiaceae bacterium]
MRTGTVAVVTGGSRGIGAATAVELATRGWDVCIAYVQDEVAATKVVAECEATGRRVAAVRADVASATDVAALFAAADELGPLGALVNNAGIVPPVNRVEDAEPTALARLLAVNVIGPFLCAREAVLRMSTRHGGAGGSIVNVSSIAARHGAPGEHVDYAASKGALDSMTIGMAKEVAGEGVRVNTVRPGTIATDIQLAHGDPERLVRRARETPIGRLGEPIEVASAIAWLCSDEASFVVGAVLDIGGGR